MPRLPRLNRADLLLLLAALVAGALFFASLERLWPLARMDLHVPDGVLEARARAVLLDAGFEVAEHAAESALRVDSLLLDYLQRSFGEAEAQRLIARGFPVYRYEVLLKRRGDPDRYWVHLHPGPDGDLDVLAWGRTVQEDASGAVVDAARARRRAREALGAWLGLPGPAWREEGFYEQARPNRRDHFFVFERHLSEDPPLRERLVVTVSGAEVTAVEHALVPPEAARRASRIRRAPVVALQMAGFLLAAVAVVGAFAVFLTRLRAGTARLAPAARWVVVIGLCFFATQALRSHQLLFEWDPLWPRWVAGLQSLGTAGAAGAWILLVLFVVIAAGDALDREGPGGEVGAPRRGAALWDVARGRLVSAPVGVASLRGFLVGLVCGGVLAGSVLVLEGVTGGWPPIQPQGFFFYALNSQAPAVATLLYFLMVALVEELAYRFFAGTWLLSVTGRPWVAIVVPAVLYGTTHTGLEFLPPVEPFWGRAVALTLVGCVWGWAFLRYDALTVVLSHFSADLFIFNWPRLGSGDPVLVAKAVATVAVPLLPAAAWFLLGRRRRKRRSTLV